MDELSPGQLRVLDFIRSFKAVHDYPPTRAEIAKALGFRSSNAAEDHLKALERKGSVRLTRGIARGIVVIDSYY